MSFTPYEYSLIFFCIFDIFAYYRLLNNKLTYRFSHRSLITAHIISYVFWLSFSLANNLFPSLPLKMPLIFLFFISLFIVYKDSVYKRILWIIVTLFSIIACELLSMPLALLLTHSSFSNMTENPLFQVLGTFLSRIFFITVIELLIRTRKKIFDVFLKDFFLIILIDVVYTLTIISFFYFDTMYLTTDIAIALSVLVMFIISFIALYLLQKITKKSEEIMTTNLKLQQIEMEHKQNQDMAIVVEDLRALRHDMNNHMSVLQGLLTMEEYEDAKAYLATITEELAVANSFIFIDNKVLSVLINNKISKARQLGITLDTEFLTSTTPFSDSELCAVVGNILENAIEASSKHNNPYIYFSMRKANQQLLIQCDNTYSVAPIFEKGNLVTTKSDKAYHGIGTKTIRSVVENYHGTTDFTVDKLFHVNISVPL